MELFLAKLIGSYLTIAGFLVMVRQRSIMPAVSELARNRALMLMFAFIELAAGLALVIAYPYVSVSLAGFLSLFGWIMVIESIVYMTISARAMQRLVESFNTRSWYIGGGVASIAIGVYLAGIGFGLW
jgi:hypothetical protein